MLLMWYTAHSSQVLLCRSPVCGSLELVSEEPRAEEGKEGGGWQQEAVGRCLQALQFQGLQAAGRQGVQDHMGTDFAPCLQQVPAWGKSMPKRSPTV